MLQRDPKRRASLEEIEKHPWLQGVDPSPATKYNIPLVSYKNLSEEEHNSIIQRMVLGDIADRDAIVEYVGIPGRAMGRGFLEWAPSVPAKTCGHCVMDGEPSWQGLCHLSLWSSWPSAWLILFVVFLFLVLY